MTARAPTTAWREGGIESIWKEDEEAWAPSLSSMLQIIDRVDEIKTFKWLHRGVEDRCSTVEKVFGRGGSLGH